MFPVVWSQHYNNTLIFNLCSREDLQFASMEAISLIEGNEIISAPSDSPESCLIEDQIWLFSK